MSSLTCWLLDTRSVWPGDSIERAAPEGLSLVDESERHSILSKYRIQDARMALGSALLKRLFVSKALGIPWSDVKLGRKTDPKHGKPCHVPSGGADAALDFNVSHQAGLVVLVGSTLHDLEIGVDIVCVNERDDYSTIDQNGFDGWVDIYEEFFSPGELWDMKFTIDTIQLLDGTEISAEELGRNDRCCSRNKTLTVKLDSGQERSFSSELLIDAKLRRFYAFYCYKEAYIKMTGEAMSAPWLRQLEFSNVRAPKAGVVPRCSTIGTWGGKLEDAEVSLHGQRVEDVKLQLEAFEENFMIAVAARPVTVVPPEGFPKFHRLSVEDIYNVAAKS